MSKKKLVNGINEVSNADYHADNEYMSSSDLKLILESAEKFRDKKILGKREERHKKSFFDEGSLTHSLILEPEMVSKEYIFWDGYIKRGKIWEAFKKENERDGVTIMSSPQVKRCQSYLEAYKKNPVAAKFIEGGHPEKTICQEWNGVKVKARTDYINVEKGYIADVKTSARPIDLDSFRMTIEQYKYYLSAYLYCKVAELEYGKPFDFYFIVIDKKELYTEVYKASDTMLNNGRMLVMRAVKKYKDCKKEDKWIDEPVERIFEDEEYEVLEI